MGTSNRRLALFGLVLFLCTLSAWCLGRTAVTRRDLHLAKANSSLRLEVESLQREVEEREWRLTQGPPPPHMLGWTTTRGLTVPFSNGKFASQGVVDQWGERYLLIGSSAVPEGGEIQELGYDAWRVTGLRTSSSVELTNLRDGSVKVLYSK